MSTILFESPIFGPVISRRLGVSLGINLLPASGKVCTFDCLYCECGLNKERKTDEKMPTVESVFTELEMTLEKMRQQGRLPDVITFAGNGEPTAHPHFADIIEGVLALRDRYAPEAKVSVLSNGTQIHKPRVFDALCKVDNNILKLDTVDEAYIERVNRPSSYYRVAEQIEAFKRFDGHVMVQTMFLKGKDFLGRDVDNTTAQYVEPWLEAIKTIAPEKVMIYTIDRETPDKDLMKATHEELDGIASRLREEGFDVTVSY
ncbi:MAG: radical SAM protein [Burkholderiaceae bacterium]|nr:radical SAM protein [Burkholderiaceae bacterium]